MSLNSIHSRAVRSLVVVFLMMAGAAPLSAAIEHHIERASLRGLEGPLAVGAKVRVTNMPVGDGTNGDLELERFDIFASYSAIVVYGADGEELERMPAPASRYFRGRIAGEPDSLAFLSVSDTRVEGFIFRGERRFAVASRPRFATREARRAEGVDVFLSEVSEIDQIPLEGEGFTCDLEGSRISSARPRLSTVINGLPTDVESDGVLATGTATWVLNLAVDTDYELFVSSGSSSPNVTTFIGNLIAAASTIYNRDLQTDLFVSFLSIHTSSSDPFVIVPTASGTWNGNATTFTSNHALYELGDRWHTPPPAAAGLPRSSTILVSGKPQMSGVAWLDIICDSEFLCQGGNCGDPDANGHYAGAYAFCGGIDPPNDLSVPNPNANPNYVVPSTNYWPLLQLAHELGHNVGSSHTHCIVLPGPDQVTYSRTYVDNCFNADFNSVGAPCYRGSQSVPAEKGTVMSYCHLSVGGGTNSRFTFGKAAEASYVVPAAMRAQIQAETPTMSAITAPASLASGASGAASVTNVGGLTYSWTITNGTINSGGTTSAINFTATTNPVTVRVKATNASGCSVTDYRTVTVSCPLPTVSTQPQNAAINAGQTTNVGVAAGGTGPFNYKWYTGAPGNTGNLISDGTSNTILVGPASTTSYWVRITNSCGSVDSAAATVTVNTCVAAAISQQPANTTIWFGGNAVVTVGATGTATLAYQWYAGPSGSTTSPLPGQTTSTLTWPQDRTFDFWVRVSNACGSVNSNTFTITVRRRVPGDYNGDGIIDPAVFRPSTGQFLIKEIGTFSWGANGDTPVPGDYDGDNATDIATWTPSTGTWSIRLSSGGTVTDVWGQTGDIPAPADHDGDRKTDLIVFRPSTGTWYIKFRTGASAAVVFGQAGDVPVPGDYDNNRIDELAVFRPSTGHWFLKRATISDVYWGQNGDIAVPADYDLDGDIDIAIFRPVDGYWHIKLPSSSAIWGVGTDIPVPGMFIAGQRARATVFRPSNGTWYVKNGTGFVWGQNGDIPLSK